MAVHPSLPRLGKIFSGIWLGWLLLSTALVTAFVWASPTHRAVLLMGWGLILFWIVGFGSVCIRYGAAIAGWVRSWPMPWMVRFVLACTAMAMLEEAVTTGMTNLAPLFGVKVGEAYITASANYLDVVMFHSVCVFISLFVGWAVILRYVKFSAWEAFFLFGITGMLAEMGFSGPSQATAFAMWIPVYGWMVYIPVLSVEPPPTAKAPRWWHYPLAIVFPFPFVCLFPSAGLLSIFSPTHPHPKIDFPPIK